MRLRHRRFGPIEDVRNELLAVRQRLSATVDVSSFFLVYQKQVVGARSPGNINILTQLDVAFGAEDSQSHITPDSQSFRSEPVNAYVPCSAIAAHYEVAEIAEPRILWVVNVTDLRGHHLSFGCAGEEQELVSLER